MRNPSIIFQRLWMGSDGTGAIHNPRSIIDVRNPSILAQRLRIGSTSAMNNPMGIIDKEPIYNFSKIMDWKRRDERHS